MSPALSRLFVSLTLVSYVALSAMQASEHVHEADADNPHSTVHRHLEPHGADSQDREEAAPADHEGQIHWLDAVALYRLAYHVAAPETPPAERFTLAPPHASWVAKADYDAAPPHGPPRTSCSPRAPPSLSF